MLDFWGKLHNERSKKNAIVNGYTRRDIMKNQLSGRDNDTKAYRVDDSNHLIRKRINSLLADAEKYPVIIVSAGAGCGKTRAISDFLHQQERSFCWMQFSERDNHPVRFWENFTNTSMQYDINSADKHRKLGFPDTDEKKERFLKISNSFLMNKNGVLVWDDFHLLKEPLVLDFAQMIINEVPPCSTIILICRDLPNIAINAPQVKGSFLEINEKELDFNESELAEYLRKQELSVDSQTIREIFIDTKGWAFAVNLVARSLKRAPNYFGYVKTTLKQNIYKLMEAESWDIIPDNLKYFWVNLSLIDHLSAELVEILADGDDNLLYELKKHNAYIHFDSYLGAYRVHHLFLDFLQTKQDILTEEERRRTYMAAADWCRQNNFKMDALMYYEKVGEYESIASIFWELYGYTTHDFLCCMAGIIERAPVETIENVNFFAAFHLFALTYLGRWQEFSALAESYEQKFLLLPENDLFRNHTLGGIYYLWGNARFLMGTTDGCYDFDLYYTKAVNCWINIPPEMIQNIILPHGSWITTLGSSEAKALNGYTEAIERSVKQISLCYSGINGLDNLYRGELKFYQNSLREAEALFLQALEKGRKYKQFETIHRSLFYIMRISITQGNRAKAEQVLKELKALLEKADYSNRFISYDIALGWYCNIIRQFDKVPNWLAGEFESYGHAHFIENLGNQITARYCYLTQNYLPLLSYIGELKQRESILYGRVEILAMEACVHYQMKNKPAAWSALKDAYKTAAPNDILMPFIELGKDMRTLTAAALREQRSDSTSIIDIPRSWLESVKHKATSYAKNHSMFFTKDKLINKNTKALSSREHDVLSDLYHGFSQSEIANKRNLSINTVKMVIKNIYDKLNVHKISDLIRIAAEQNLV